jgi:hypothetical protein
LPQAVADFLKRLLRADSINMQIMAGPPVEHRVMRGNKIQSDMNGSIAEILPAIPQGRIAQFTDVVVRLPGKPTLLSGCSRRPVS